MKAVRAVKDGNIPTERLFSSSEIHQSSQPTHSNMRSKLCRAVLSRPSWSQTWSQPWSQTACFHCAARNWAIAHPITAHGPPPKAPTPAPAFKNDAQPEPRTQPKTEEGAARVSQAKSALLKRRFWNDVHVTENEGPTTTTTTLGPVLVIQC
jgi:hypothetical protein